MSQVIDFLTGLLGNVMHFCYYITRNYGLCIILFTLLTKAVLFPVSLLTQKNSIRMVKLQPELDQLKIKYIDDKDKYTDEQLALYKKYKYNPFLDVLPLCLQIPIVLGLVAVVYRPLSYVLDFDKNIIEKLQTWLTETLGVNDAGRTYQMRIIEKIHSGIIPSENAVSDAVEKISGFSTSFLGLDLGMTPSLKNPSALLIIPILAGISAWVLCFFQNRINVLQLTQGKLNKIITTVFMISFSVYFSFIVPAGVGLYWIAGNLFSIPLMLLNNLLISPKKHIDYKRFEEMRTQKLKKEEEHRRYSKREKEDYKRFFAVKDMQLMFYSEQNGFYKYFSGIIDYLCDHSDITIHYVTSDPDDNIFKDKRKQIQAYYVASDRYLVPLFMKLDTDMCVMTMPDLEKYHIKRSRVRDDVEYVFACHAMGSLMMYRKGALDWFDTFLSPNTDQSRELRALEKLSGAPEKLIVEAGYPLIDKLIADYQSKEHVKNEIPKIIIAPSWQKDNLIDLCIDDIFEELGKSDYKIVLRPHPQHVRHESERFENMKEKYASCDNIEIQTDFTKDEPVMEADLLITDWSGIAWEYAFVTKRPVLYIDTPMKVMNHDYEKIGIEPINKTHRTELGEVLSKDEIKNINSVIEKMLASRETYEARINKILEEHMYNVGHSSEICGRYILKSLKAKRMH